MQASLRTVPYRDRAQARQKKRARIKGVLYAVAMCVGIGASVWGLLYSPAFAVTTVNVNGTSEPIRKLILESVQQQIGYERFGFLYTRRNIFLLDTESIIVHLRQEQPLVASITASRHLPHSLIFDVKERTPLGIWCAAVQDGEDECSFFDADGVRWGQAVPSAGTLMLSVQDERDGGAPGAALIGMLQDIRTRLLSYDVHILRFNLPVQGAGDVVLTTSDGWDGLFHMDETLDEQISTMEAYIMDRRRDGGITVKSIDARIAGRLYVK